ncbi:PEP-CTERM sorting domain-containing protein [Desulfococcaceae bacterium HSG9]|nr:PEP-CTERM sorting domain-containing protein [Desulfococcaceae bacterium HSG9]
MATGSEMGSFHGEGAWEAMLGAGAGFTPTLSTTAHSFWYGRMYGLTDEWHGQPGPWSLRFAYCLRETEDGGEPAWAGMNGIDPLAVSHASAFVVAQGDVFGVGTPVPEPGTWLIMTVGLGALIWVRRRRV